MGWSELLRGCIGGGTAIRNQAQFETAASLRSCSSDADAGAATTASLSSSCYPAEATLTLRLVPLGQLPSPPSIDLPEHGLSASVWAQSGDTWIEAPTCAEAQAALAQMTAQDSEFRKLLGQQAMAGQAGNTPPGTYRLAKCRGECCPPPMSLRAVLQRSTRC